MHGRASAPLNPERANRILQRAPAASRLPWPHRSKRGPSPRPRPLALKEDPMKELTLQEVLRIAGGVPNAAALDELTYRAPEESPQPVDYARLPGKDLPGSEPT